ncbi:MAG TPA: hypothetical protein VE953_12000 [Terriglobales bacterium]|nr:hypothetical protein [Terriglobales bacterium]
MLFRNVSRTTLVLAAAEAGVRLVDLRAQGRGYRARLGLLPDPLPAGRQLWQRRSASWSRPNRRVAAVCWHGHLAFFARVFDLAPDAVVRGGRGSSFEYRGAREFLARFEATGDANIGSSAYPNRYRDACFCERGQVALAYKAVARLERSLAARGPVDKG